MISRAVVATVASLLLFTQAFGQDLIFTAPPREKPAQGAKLYGPLAAHFSKVLKTKVVYQHPGNWLNYQRGMRNGKYDIVFDGPHFAAWRMAHLKHDMLVKLPGTLVFYLLGKKGDASVKNTNDLIGQKICGISPPNLSTLSILDHYRNPVRQPVIKGVRGGMGGVYKTFMKGASCKALVLRNTFYKKKLTDEKRAGLNLIYESRPLPNQVISAGPRISNIDKGKLAKSLISGPGAKAALPVAKRFGGKKAKGFIYADNKEYEGHNMLLEGVIFGW